MNFKLPHWAQLVIGLLVVILGWVMNQMASGALVLPAWGVTLLTVVKTVIGIFSSSAANGGGAGKAQARGFARLRLLVAVAVLGVVGLGARLVTGCNVVAPISDCGSAILADAAKGMTVTQIVEDVGARCSVDAATVIATLLASKDPAVTSSKAYAEAIRAHGLLPDGGL